MPVNIHSKEHNAQELRSVADRREQDDQAVFNSSERDRDQQRWDTGAAPTAGAIDLPTQPRQSDGDVVIQTGVEEHAKELPVIAEVGMMDILRQWALLGWTAFGGPQAHIGLFEKRFVEKLRWCSASVFMELLALGQCLPGPTSTQMSFALGATKQGVKGGMLSGALFQYPGAVVMTLVGIGAGNVLTNPSKPVRAVVLGIAAAAVALVASAAKGLLSKVVKDRITACLATLAAVLVYYYPAPYMFPSIIAFGGLVTYLASWKKEVQVQDLEDESVQQLGLNLWQGIILLVVCFGFLIFLLFYVNVPGHAAPWEWLELFYRTGAIIYGGGQVVLPLLWSDLTKCDANGKCNPDAWVTSEQFYAGLGLAQAMPGPLFNFAAYLGAVIAKNEGYHPLLGAVLCWFGLFGPGIMILFGVLPFWGRFRKWHLYRKALPGLNAAAVGLVVASLFQMGLDVYRTAVQDNLARTSICIGIIAFASVDTLKIFEPLVIFVGGVLGVVVWALNGN